MKISSIILKLVSVKSKSLFFKRYGVTLETVIWLHKLSRQLEVVYVYLFLKL